MERYVAINQKTKETIKYINTFEEAVSFVKDMYLLDENLKVDIYDNFTKSYMRKG